MKENCSGFWPSLGFGPWRSQPDLSGLLYIIGLVEWSMVKAFSALPPRAGPGLGVRMAASPQELARFRTC